MLNSISDSILNHEPSSIQTPSSSSSSNPIPSQLLPSLPPSSLHPSPPPSPSPSSSSSLPYPSPLINNHTPLLPPPVSTHQQFNSNSFKPPSSRPQRRMSSPSVQIKLSNNHPSPSQSRLDDIIIGGECGVVNGGTVLRAHQPSASQNWIASHLTIVLQHSFTVSSPHPITSEPHSVHPHYLHSHQSSNPQFLPFREPPSPEHLRNKFSNASLSSLTTSTTDEDEDDETDDVAESDSQNSTASSYIYLNLNQPSSSQLTPHEQSYPSQNLQSSRPSLPTLPPNSPFSNPPFRLASPTASISSLPSSMSTQESSSRLHLIGILNTWSFDANSLSPLQIRTSLHILLSVYLKYTPGFIQQLEELGVVDPDQCLRGLVDNLEVAYDSRNPYHNFRHAVDVVQAIYTILSHEGVVPPLGWVLKKESGVECEYLWQRQPVGRVGHLLDEMSIWSLLLAAAGHDVGHPGLSNAFMVNARTPIAHVFSDGAVLENFHRITFTRMLREHGFGKMVDGHAGFRQVLVGAVLSTDMGRHFPIVEQLKRLASQWSHSHSDDSATDLDEMAQKVLITAGLMKCGDISNSSRPHHISLTWSSCLLTEWSRQAALEADLHLPVSVVTLDPAEKRAQAKSQIGFTSLFVFPLFTIMEQLSPIAFRPFAGYCRLGMATWQKVIEHIDSQSLGPGPSLATHSNSDSIKIQSPLSPNSLPSERHVHDPPQDLIPNAPRLVQMTPVTTFASPTDSFPHFNLSHSHTSSIPAESHLTPKSQKSGWWACPSSRPISDDYSAEDANLSSISSSSVSTLRESSHLTHMNRSDQDTQMACEFTPSKNPPPPGLDAHQILTNSNEEPPTFNRPFTIDFALSHPGRLSDASLSSEEGKANSLNDSSSFSSLGSSSSPPRSPYFNSVVISASSNTPSNDGASSHVVAKEVQLVPSDHPNVPSQHLQSPRRPRDKGMSVDVGSVQRNLTRTSLPIRKKSYSPHLINQQVACAKGCGKVTVKCVKCATESKIRMYRSLSLAKPSLFRNGGVPPLPSPRAINVPQHSSIINQPYPNRLGPLDTIDIFNLPKFTEEKSLGSANAAPLPDLQLTWPPHPFRPLC